MTELTQVQQLSIYLLGLNAILIGIPTAVEFYPSLFLSLFGWLPLGWMLQLGIFLLGIFVGWYLCLQNECGDLNIHP